MRVDERRKVDGEELGREELSQYECGVCGDQHYHTKKQLKLLELPGYQFANPCPPSVRSVSVLKHLASNSLSLNLKFDPAYVICLFEIDPKRSTIQGKKPNFLQWSSSHFTPSSTS